jgi:hypothetical protein
MKTVRRARKVTQNEDTKQVHVSQCGFFWDDVVAVEDTAGSTYDHDQPRAWICLYYDAFYIEGDFETVYQEWLDFVAIGDTALKFTRN